MKFVISHKIHAECDWPVFYPLFHDSLALFSLDNTERSLFNHFSENNGMGNPIFMCEPIFHHPLNREPIWMDPMIEDKNLVPIFIFSTPKKERIPLNEWFSTFFLFTIHYTIFKLQKSFYLLHSKLNFLPSFPSIWIFYVLPMTCVIKKYNSISIILTIESRLSSFFY